MPHEGVVLYHELHDLIQDAPLTSTDFTTLQIRRESMLMYEDDLGYWNVGGLYNFDIHAIA
jgi:hypothetical protein